MHNDAASGKKGLSKEGEANPHYLDGCFVPLSWWRFFFYNATVCIYSFNPVNVPLFFNYWFLAVLNFICKALRVPVREDGRGINKYIII